VELIPAPDASEIDFEAAAREIIAAELAGVPVLVDRLIRGELSVC
jgi:hypothetical protein